MRLRRFALLLGVSLLSCASPPRPVLYPNDHLNRVGREQAQRDVDECLALSAQDVGPPRRDGSQVVRNAAVSGAAGAAVGAAVAGAADRNAGRGAAGGAAGGEIGRAHV